MCIYWDNVNRMSTNVINKENKNLMFSLHKVLWGGGVGVILSGSCPVAGANLSTHPHSLHRWALVSCHPLL